MRSPLVDSLDRDDVRPYFLWDSEVTLGELRRLLRHPDERIRALWMARVMREARYADVWKLLSVNEVAALFPRIRMHLGRSRRFWDFLIGGWRTDGLLPTTP